MNYNYLKHIATAEPTYWPSDQQKVSDPIDFYITKGVDLKKLEIQSNSDLSSDHSPIILIVTTDIIGIPRKSTICNCNTN